MKHLAKFTALAMVASLWSCSDDLPGNEQGGQEANGDFYANVTLQLPSSMGSRSETVDPTPGGNNPAQSNNGYELGLDSENNISELMIVLATQGTDGSYTYVTSASTTTPIGTPGSSNNMPTYVMKFQSDAIINQAENTLHIFAYCNPTAAMKTNIASSFNPNEATDEISAGHSSADGATPIRIGISEANNFLMTNATLASTQLPSKEILKECNTKDKAFNLGKVTVERVSCRFDFKQTTKNENLGPNVYPISIDNNVYANVELLGMSLFNESKDFYLFPRMSADGLNTNIDLCGNELPTNYVVSTNAQVKQNYTGSADVASLYYYPTAEGALPQSFKYTFITEASLDDQHVTSKGDNWLWGADEEPYKGYKIWRYATENTIPAGSTATPNSNQRNGISTGIYFKAELKGLANAEEGSLAHKINEAITAGEPIYAYKEDTKQGNQANIDMLLGSAQEVWAYCVTRPESPVTANFIKAWEAGIFTITKDGKEVEKTETDHKVIFAEGNVAATADKANQTPNEELKAYNFLCYYPTKDAEGAYHYYTYYPYYNRHNNNGQNTVMGQMEFATVRNNVYKLSVDNITRIGLPGDVPPDPGTEDETDEIYLMVTCEVLDWVVRLNNIEF